MTDYVSQVLNNNNQYNKYKFVKISGYSSKEIIQLVKALDIYDDENNLILIDEFISELYEDIKSILSHYRFVYFIKILFTQSNKEKILSYDIIFNNLFSYVSSFDDGMCYYVNFFELDDEKFKQIIPL